MISEQRAVAIAEVRAHLADIDVHASPDKLGGGRTEVWLKALVEEIDETRAEIARLTNLAASNARMIAWFDPPETDVMERALAIFAALYALGKLPAKSTLGDTTETLICTRKEFCDLAAHALTEYGNQRAHEAEAATRALATRGSADMLERARHIINDAELAFQKEVGSVVRRMNPQAFSYFQEHIARALTEYGDRRAHEAEAATRALATRGSADMLERASKAVDSWNANSGFTMAEHVADAMRDCAREARAVAFEEVRVIIREIATGLGSLRGASAARTARFSVSRPSSGWHG